MQPKPAPARLLGAFRFAESLRYPSFSNGFFYFSQKKFCHSSSKRPETPKRGNLLLRISNKSYSLEAFLNYVINLFKMQLILNYMT
jgi:hypothetical protein